MTRKIVTEYKDFAREWLAYDSNSYEPPDGDGSEGGLLGIGATEAEALADLDRLYTEEAEYQEDRRLELERVSDPRMDPKL